MAIGSKRSSWRVLFIFVLSFVLAPSRLLGGVEKLDFELKALLSGREAGRGTVEPAAIDGQEIHALIKVREPTQAIRNLGVELRTSAGDVYTSVIPVSSLNLLANLEEVLRIESAQRVAPALDTSIPEILADRVWDRYVDSIGESITGKGVILGIVDSGVDINHESFRDENGVTRIRWIWDMSDSSGLPPEGFLCGDPPGSILCGGTECTPDDLLNNSCIETDDEHGGHGTHVLGIAAGRGTPGGLYRGVAYDTDLIVVKLGVWNTNEILEGVNYIFTRAAEEGKPAVVNLSLSAFRGARDGSSLLEQYLDALAGPGRVIVAAAGNNGTDAYHSKVYVSAPQGESEEIVTTVFSIPSYGNTWVDGSMVHIEGWYSVGQGVLTDRVSIQLKSPPHETVSPYLFPKNSKTYPEQDTWLEFGQAVFEKDTATGADGTVVMDHRGQVLGEDGGQVLARGFVIEIRGTETVWTPLIDGLWSLRLKGQNLSKSTLKVDVWIDPLSTVSGNAPTFMSPDYYTTITPPSTADKVICVGSFSNKCEWRDLDGREWEWTDRCVPPDKGAINAVYNEFSGKGPRRDGLRKPELIAPGQGVVSALSTDVVLPDYSRIVLEGYQIGSGTSMASPHVAGVVALMLQADSDLEPTEVIDHLRQAGGADWDGKWGWGRLDALEAVQRTMGISPSSRSGQGGDDFCFIATAVFGGLDAPAVTVLRGFRDEVLVRSSVGRCVTNGYYRFSPPLADWLITHPHWQSAVRCALRPAVGFAHLSSRLGFPQGMLLLLVCGMAVLGFALSKVRQ